MKRTNSEYSIGGVGISINDKAPYFDLEKLDSVYTWRKSWFYLKDWHTEEQQFGLAHFDPAARAVKRSSWAHLLSAREVSFVETLVQKIAALKDELTGGQFISVFVRRRVQPLQHRVRPMLHYTRPDNSTRCSREEFSDGDILTRVQQVTKCTSIGEESLVRPYAAEFPLP